MAAQVQKCADLDLQIGLLAEHEITRLIILTDAIAEHLETKPVQDPELEELTQDIAPEQVLDTMETLQKQTAADATSHRIRARNSQEDNANC